MVDTSEHRDAHEAARIALADIGGKRKDHAVVTQAALTVATQYFFDRLGPAAVVEWLRSTVETDAQLTDPSTSPALAGEIRQMLDTMGKDIGADLFARIVIQEAHLAYLAAFGRDAAVERITGLADMMEAIDRNAFLDGMVWQPPTE